MTLRNFLQVLGADPEAEASSDPEDSDDGGDSHADDATRSPTHLTEDCSTSVGNPPTASPEPSSPPDRNLPISARKLEGALYRYLQQKAAHLFRPDRSVAIPTILRQIHAGQVPALSALQCADDIWNLVVMRPSRFEVLSSQPLSVRAISHVGSALFGPCEPPVPKIIRSKHTPRKLIYIYNPGAPQDIPNTGWECSRHCRPDSPYIEFLDPKSASTTQRPGVAFKAKKAVHDQMVLLQRADNTFYTTGFDGKIDFFYAESWAAEAPLSGPTSLGPPPDNPPTRGSAALASKRRAPPPPLHSRGPDPIKRRRS